MFHFLILLFTFILLLNERKHTHENFIKKNFESRNSIELTWIFFYLKNHCMKWNEYGWCTTQSLCHYIVVRYMNWKLFYRMIFKFIPVSQCLFIQYSDGCDVFFFLSLFTFKSWFSYHHKLFVDDSGWPLAIIIRLLCIVCVLASEQKNLNSNSWLKFSC